MRLEISFTALVAAGAVLASCGGSGNSDQAAAPDEAANTPPAQEARVVNVYSARHYDSDRIIYERFTEETGIEINLVEAGGDLLIERVRADGERSPADVIVTVDAARLHRAEQAGLFQPIQDQEILGMVPAELRDPQGYWLGFTARARVIAYSTERVDPSTLTSYEALAGDDWDGRLCMRTSDNAYNQSLLASRIIHNGEASAEEWANGIAANLAVPPSGGDTDQIRAIAAGTCDASFVNHYYYVRIATSEAPEDQAVTSAVALYAPGEAYGGAHINVSGVGIAAGAPHPDEAREFIRFLLSEDSQRVFAEVTNEIPARTGVTYDNPRVAEISDWDRDTVNLGELGDHTETAVRIFDRAEWP
ncbi:MAG: Fe(3+) ABC transporter substrate-binding protein [Maricaulis sp.]|jgi:iron(III) transport system substrate-binding protein|nr:Fe(3+) ABC transporter substrate-binding protein [Maricaulis sp.]HAQ33744.1 Fe(3+) ABC transporter substrate-binding protein [Alphaproteobacteria bacterium]